MRRRICAFTDILKLIRGLLGNLGKIWVNKIVCREKRAYFPFAHANYIAWLVVNERPYPLGLASILFLIKFSLAL
jgi:hypothetical protein